MSRRKTILGIDPGLADLGWGVVSLERNRVELIEYGVIKTKAHVPLAERLLAIHMQLATILKTHKPDQVGIEKLFFGKNAKTAMSVGEARGVVVLTLCQHELTYDEFTPASVKIALTGFGNADKKQVQEMVKHTLKLDAIPKPDDAADALAIAITVAHSTSINQKLKEAMSQKGSSKELSQKIKAQLAKL